MTHSVVVHLVHGTWPYGPFRRHPPQADDRPRAWFDVASDFAHDLHRFSNETVVFESFRWTGAQSMAARAQASEDFLAHLQRSIVKHGDASHVVVAHSHGGTVVANALMTAAFICQDQSTQRGADQADFLAPFDAVSKVKAVVCLASPFTYVSANAAHARAFSLAPIVLTGAAGSAAALLLFPAFVKMLPALLLFIAHMGLVIATALIMLFVPMKDRALFPAITPIPESAKVFLIRATNDEAALVIGLGQSISWLLRWFYLPFVDDGKKSTLPVVIVFLLLLLGSWLVPNAFGLHDLTFWQRLAVSFAVIPGFFGALFLLGCLILGLVLGVLNPRYWMLGEPTADPTPPGIPCSFKSYSELYFPKPAASLRHGIYDDPRVRDDIVQVIRGVASGKCVELRREADLRIEGREMDILLRRHPG